MRLVTAATELGGRLNSTARGLLEQAAHARARDEPAALRSAAEWRWDGRWLVMLAVAAQGAVAASLVDDGVGLADFADASPPAPADLWVDGDFKTY